VAVLSIAAIPAFVLLPGTLHHLLGLVNRLEGLSGIGLLGLMTLFVAPLVGLLAPHLTFSAGTPGVARRRRWALPAIATVTAVALFAWGIATSGFDAAHPRPNQIAYHLNSDTGVAEWVSFDRHLDDWTGQFFPADAEPGEFDSILLETRPAFVAPAPAVDPTGWAEVSVVSDAMVGDVRMLELRFTSPRGARLMATEIEAAGEVLGIEVNGRAVEPDDLDVAGDGSFRLIYHNAPMEGWTLKLAVRSVEPVVIDVETSDDGLPDMPGVEIAPRPAEMMPAPGYASDPTIVSRTVAI
jgi:hypothetical protein